MIVTWQVDDGYCGGRPHTFEIPDEEFKDCSTEKEKQVIIEEWVQQEFDNNISWFIQEIEE